MKTQVLTSSDRLIYRFFLRSRDIYTDSNNLEKENEKICSSHQQITLLQKQTCFLKQQQHSMEDAVSDVSAMDTRISPLRGNMSQEDIVNQTKIVRNGLGALRDDHYTILARIRDEHENRKNANNNIDNSENTSDSESSLQKECKNTNVCRAGEGGDALLEDRIANVSSSLEQLEIGLAESNVLLSLNDHFERMEADRMTLRLEMGRVQDENEWLREELGDTQKQLQEAVAELAELREEKKAREFEEELKNISETSNARPVTPSKIPVGSWRVEEEKDINRALAGGSDISRSRAVSPGPSRIPVGGWRTTAKLSVYKKVMEKEEASQKLKQAKKNSTSTRNQKSSYFKLNASRMASKIPSR